MGPGQPAGSLVFLEVADLVEEGLVEGLSAQRAAQQLDVEAPLFEGQRQLVRDDRLVLVEAGGARHLLLEHAGEELCRLVWLRQAHAAHQLFKQAQVLLLEALARQ